MSDTLVVAIVETLENLLEYSRGHLLREKLFCNNLIEQLPTRAQFGHQVYILFVFEVFVELQDIRVIKLLQNGDLLLKPVHILDLLFGDSFNCPLLPGLLVLAPADNSKGSCS